MLSGSGAFRKNGANELELRGDSTPTFAGTTSINGGSLYLPGGLTQSGNIILNDGFLELGNENSLGSSYSGTISFNGGLFKQGQVKDYSAQFSTADNQQYKFEILGPTDGIANFASPLTSQGGSLELVGGNLVLSDVNTYTGATKISSGTLLVNGELSESTAVTVDKGAVFEPFASPEVGSIEGSGEIVISSPSLTVGGLNSDTTFDGVITEAEDSRRAQRTLTLSGANRYGSDGGEGGVLSLDATGSLSDAAMFC